MTIKGNDVIYLSDRQYVAVTHNPFGMGMQYNVYRKKNYPLGETGWEYQDSFDTVYEAVEYAKMMVDIVEWEPQTYQDGGGAPAWVTHSLSLTRPPLSGNELEEEPPREGTASKARSAVFRLII